MNPEPSFTTTALRTLVPRAARNWLRSPRQTLEWGFHSALFAVGHTEQLEMRSGWILRAHPLAARRAYVAQLADPEQLAELDAFVRDCQPGMRLLDVGAHFGAFSLAALHYGGATASALAVDPSHSATRMIRLQSRLNGVEDRLHVVEACAARTDGRREMLDTGVIGAGYFVAADPVRPRSELSQVRAITLDTLCDELRFQPTHVKIDVEGDELDVLCGAAALLSRQSPPHIALELHNTILRSRGHDPGQVVLHLEALGYACEDVLSGRVDSLTFRRDVSRLVARHPAG